MLKYCLLGLPGRWLYTDIRLKDRNLVTFTNLGATHNAKMDFLEIKRCLISLRESGKVFLVPHTQKCVTDFYFVFLSLYYISKLGIVFVFLLDVLFYSFFFGGGG